MEQKRQVFTVDELTTKASKGHGVITCMAAGNDAIVVGTDKGWIIRHDYRVGDPYGIIEDIELNYICNDIFFTPFHHMHILAKFESRAQLKLAKN